MSESQKMQSFMDLYTNGYVMDDEVDDFVDQWHESPYMDETSVSLSDYLGMTDEEYEVWLHDASVLPHIVRARQKRIPLDDVLHDHVEDMLLAARADNKTAVEALGKWLSRRKKA
jgi:hypothetical protein